MKNFIKKAFFIFFALLCVDVRMFEQNFSWRTGTQKKENEENKYFKVIFVDIVRGADKIKIKVRGK